MSGHLSGVATRIQQDVPAALFVHCLAHCTNLVLQTIGRKCVPVRDALDLIIELTQLIRYSPKRSSLFQGLQAQLSQDSSHKAQSLKPLCPTRWTVRTATFQSIVSNYTILCEALEEINAECHDEYGRKAGGFLAQLEKFSTYFEIKLSYLIFSGIELLSLTLQGKDTTVQEATDAAELALRYLERQRVDKAFDSFYFQAVEQAKDLTDPPALPRYRNPPRRLDDGSVAHRFNDPKEYFKSQYFEVLDLLMNELKRPFQQERGIPVAAAIEKVLIDCSNGEAVSLPQQLEVYKNDLDLTRLRVQLSMLPDLIKTKNQKVHSSFAIKKVTNVRTICTFMNEVEASKTMLSEVNRLLQIFLTIPVTTSTAERTFSSLRHLKTFLRSTMTQPRLNNLMIMYVHKDKTEQFDILDIAEKFIV